MVGELRAFVLRQMLPEIVETIAATTEFLDIPSYRSFQRVLHALKEPENPVGIDFERYHRRHFARIRRSEAENRQTAKVKMKLAVTIMARNGFGTRIEPVKIWLKLEGDYATKAWRYASLTVKLPSGDRPLYFWVTPSKHASWEEVIVARRTLDAQVV